MNKFLLVGAAATAYILWLRKKTQLGSAFDDITAMVVKETKGETDAFARLNDILQSAGQSAYVDKIEAGNVMPTIADIERATGIRVPRDIAEGIENSKFYREAMAKEKSDPFHDPEFAARAAQQYADSYQAPAYQVKPLRVRGGQRSYPNLERDAGQSTGWGETTDGQIAAYHRRLAENNRLHMARTAKMYQEPRRDKPAQYPTRLAQGNSSGVKIDPTFLRRR